MLGSEALHAYASCDKHGKPIMCLPGAPNAPLPYLSYTGTAYFGRMAELILADARKNPFLEKCHEADMAEGLKMMALEGQGIAFLPESAVVHEVQQRLLARADAGNREWQISMQIRLYRERPSMQRPGKSLVTKLWNYLKSPATARRRGQAP